ncbi:MAG: hypothetical protein HC802_15865 [Caldilineaceae bacterium]|nr:hypothetical protein [Caldilineaceae bacterium]
MKNLLLLPISDLIRRGWRLNWPLTLAGISYLMLAPILLAAIWLDPRVITGAPAWVKPLKFVLSTGIYALTFLWLLNYVQGRRRWVQLAAGVTGLALAVENVLIILQVLRGTTSHFNNSTLFDAAVFGIMGAFIGVAALMNLLLAIWLIRQRMPTRCWRGDYVWAYCSRSWA